MIERTPTIEDIAAAHRDLGISHLVQSALTPVVVENPYSTFFRPVEHAPTPVAPPTPVATPTFTIRELRVLPCIHLDPKIVERVSCNCTRKFKHACKLGLGNETGKPGIVSQASTCVTCPSYVADTESAD